MTPPDTPAGRDLTVSKLRLLARGLFLAGMVAIAGCAVPALPSTPAVSGPTTGQPGRSPAGSLAAPLVPGLGWVSATVVEAPAQAIELPSGSPAAPLGPGTAGHPGHFPGQVLVTGLATDGDRLVAVGSVGLRGSWSPVAWWSDDGDTWRLAAIAASPPAFAVAVAAAPDGGWVAVGREERRAAVWTSPDGLTWTASPVPPAGAAAERMTSVTVVDGAYLAGGSAGPELGLRDARLWRSDDGTHWEPVGIPSPEGTEIRDTSPAGAGWVAVGTIGPAQRPTGSVAWRSPDGAGAPVRLDDEELARGLAVALTRRADGSIVAVGSDADERTARVWLSSDGGSWEAALGEASRRHPSVGRIRMTDVVADGGGLVAIGNWVGVQFGQGTSWRSTDGRRWERAPVQPPLAQSEPAAIVAASDELVAVGTFGAPDNYLPRAWRTPRR